MSIFSGLKARMVADYVIRNEFLGALSTVMVFYGSKTCIAKVFTVKG